MFTDSAFLVRRSTARIEPALKEQRRGDFIGATSMAPCCTPGARPRVYYRTPRRIGGESLIP